MVVRTLAFVILRRVLGVVGLGPSLDARDLEIAVLRHQLMVLRRQVARHRYARGSDGVGRVGAVVAAGALAGIRKRWSIAPAVCEMLSKQPKKDCPISLQNHGDEAWFRDVKIRRLSAK